MLTPLEITIITTLIGATWLGYIFHSSRLGISQGIVLGAVAGAIGPHLFLYPLEYCSLDPEKQSHATLHLLGWTTPVNVVGMVTMILIAIGVLALGTLFHRIFIQFRHTGRFIPYSDATPGTFKSWWFMPWLLLAPTLIVLVLFTYLPAVQTFSLSTELARLGAPRTAPVCLNNFANLFAGTRENAEYFILSHGHILSVQSAPYWNVLGTSFFLAFFITLFANLIGLFIALMAYQPIKGAKVYRTLLIWPFALSAVVSGIIFNILFNPVTGFINHVLKLLGVATVPWLLDPNIAPWAVVITATWNILGFNLLFYIAGLQNVPKDLQEAAAIDGANAVQRFIRIIIPMLSPFIFFLIFTNLTYSFFDLFGLIDNLTGGGPVNSTRNLIYDIYVVGIQNKDLGKAAAQSILLLSIVIGLTALQFRTLGKRVNYGA